MGDTLWLSILFWGCGSAICFAGDLITGIVLIAAGCALWVLDNLMGL